MSEWTESVGIYIPNYKGRLILSTQKQYLLAQAK